MIMEKAISGLAMESDTAFVEANGRIKYIKCNEASNVYFFRNTDGIVVKEQMETEMINE
jgi:hypothetical protein